jgi:phosphatidylglycerol:prolipoprotein diacylglycerol transferase
MRPILVDRLAVLVGDDAAQLLVPGYFTFVALAAIAGALLLRRAARREGLPVEAVLLALGAGYLAAIAGGLVLPAAADLARQLVAGGPVRPRWAGMVAYGGFFAGFGVAALVLRRAGVPFARFAEIAAAPTGLAIALVRVGCFVAGCDYGEITASPLAVRFPAGSHAFVEHVAAGLVPPARAWSLPVHPAQLYEAALGVLIFAVASRRSGHRFLAACALYAAGRIAIESVRGDASRGVLLGVSTSQLLGALVLAGCALAIARRHRAAAAVLGLALLAAPARAERGLDFGVTAGAAAPLNRGDQVPASGLFTFSVGYTFLDGFGLGLLLEAGTNEVASHGTIMGLATLHAPLGASRFELAGHAGLGSTTVDFDDESFASERAFAWRGSVGVEWFFGERWAFGIYPLGIDVIQDADLGGAIVSYQTRLGLAWSPRRARRATPPQAVAPPPAPLPQQPPPPQPGELPPGWRR